MVAGNWLSLKRSEGIKNVGDRAFSKFCYFFIIIYHVENDSWFNYLIVNLRSMTCCDQLYSINLKIEKCSFMEILVFHTFI